MINHIYDLLKKERAKKKEEEEEEFKNLNQTSYLYIKRTIIYLIKFVIFLLIWRFYFFFFFFIKYQPIFLSFFFSS